MLSPRTLLIASLAVLSLAGAAAADELAAARELFAARRLPEAQAAFEKLAVADPRNAEVQYHLGDLALRRNADELAVSHLERATTLDPKLPRAHKRLADAYTRAAASGSAFSKLGWAKKALAAYQRAVELDPANVDFRQALLDYYREAPGIAGGSKEKAFAEAAAIKQLDAWRGRLAFAGLYLAGKQYARALAEFDDVLAASPDDYNALYQVGRIAAISGQFLDRGATALLRCLELTPPATPHAPNHATVHWRLGQIREYQSDPAAARAAYTAALELDPTLTAAATALGKLR